MIFVDTNVFMYTVGSPHPLREPAQQFLDECLRAHTSLCTSAEVVQELLRAYLPVSRQEKFEACLRLLARLNIEVWSLEFDDITLARQLHDRYPHLGARDLCHLASCRRRGVSEIKTFDRALHAIAGTGAPEESP